MKKFYWCCKCFYHICIMILSQLLADQFTHEANCLRWLGFEFRTDEVLSEDLFFQAHDKFLAS